MYRLSRPAAIRTFISPKPLRQSHLHQRRLLSSAPPAHKSRSFKNGFARWALAAGGLYWYMTRDVDVFAEDAHNRLAPRAPIIQTYDEAEQLPTVESVSASKRQAREARGLDTPRAGGPTPPPVTQDSSAESAAPAASANASSQVAQPAAASPASLEEEAEAEGAFNEETGEINWDCPCLGGMAHGPCGEQFREAFSCFVFSKEDPKGIDCIDRFKNMQDCFRLHPDVYGSELTDMDEDPDAPAEGATATEPQVQSTATSSASTSDAPSASKATEN